MNRSSLTLLLERVVEFLDGDAALLMRPEARSRLSEKAKSLLEKARCPAELLYVGLLGGTGVGKSTLINALAGRHVSTPSDRRPFTDRAVVYRHSAVSPGLESVQHLLRMPDTVHDSDTIRDLVLLDLPDFDSQEQANRRTVVEILPKLDSVVWVVSPEKYADAAFYRFVKQTSVSKEHFTFVLNKADELTADNEQQRHQILKEVLGDLMFRLGQEAAVEQPLIFKVSALSEFEGKPTDPILRNEFRKFRDFLMGKRDAKEIAAIKTTNIIEQTMRVLDELNDEIQPREKAQLISALNDIRSGRPQPVGDTDSELREDERKLSRGLLRLMADQDCSVGLVSGGMRLLLLARGREALTGAEGLRRDFVNLSQKLWSSRSAELERVAAHAESELMFCLGHGEALPTGQDPSVHVASATRQSFASLSPWIVGNDEQAKSIGSRILRLGQGVVLSFPALILVLRLVGPDRAQAWLNHPTLSGVPVMAVAGMTSLLGSEGLIGLTALTLCEGILVWCLAARRLKKIEKMSRSVARAAVEVLRQKLDLAFQEIEANRTERLERVAEALDSLNAINSSVRPSPHKWKNLQLKQAQGQDP